MVVKGICIPIRYVTDIMRNVPYDEQRAVISEVSNKGMLSLSIHPIDHGERIGMVCMELWSEDDRLCTCDLTGGMLCMRIKF